MKKIVIIKGHPRNDSLCNALVEKYIEGAKINDVETRTLDLRELALERWLKYDWSRNHNWLPEPPDLDHSKELVTWSNHIVFAYPTYWAGPPALVKLFLEMVITAHFAFRYKKPFLEKIPHWNKLLKGKTATIISTMDAPPVIMALIDLDLGGKMLHDILRFCGIQAETKVLRRLRRALQRETTRAMARQGVPYRAEGGTVTIPAVMVALGYPGAIRPHHGGTTEESARFCRQARSNNPNSNRQASLDQRWLSQCEFRWCQSFWAHCNLANVLHSAASTLAFCKPSILGAGYPHLVLISRFGPMWTGISPSRTCFRP